MSRHLKTIVIRGLEAYCGSVFKLPPFSAPRARGVRYLEPFHGIDFLFGAMNTDQEPRHYHKHIIVRRSPEHNGLLQLYTYHFPKTWSAGCVANRELIKEAQRRAHALEHAQTAEAHERKLRFFHHYFAVYKGGAKPEPGLKPYSRFYQYTFVCIYRELQQARQQTQASPSTSEDVTFAPITISSLNRLRPLNNTPTYRTYSRWATRKTLDQHENISIFEEKPPEYLHICKKSSTFAPKYGFL